MSKYFDDLIKHLRSYPSDKYEQLKTSHKFFKETFPELKRKNESMCNNEKMSFSSFDYMHKMNIDKIPVVRYTINDCLEALKHKSIKYLNIDASENENFVTIETNIRNFSTIQIEDLEFDDFENSKQTINVGTFHIYKNLQGLQPLHGIDAKIFHIKAHLMYLLSWIQIYYCHKLLEIDISKNRNQKIDRIINFIIVIGIQIKTLVDLLEHSHTADITKGYRQRHFDDYGSHDYKMEINQDNYYKLNDTYLGIYYPDENWSGVDFPRCGNVPNAIYLKYFAKIDLSLNMVKEKKVEIAKRTEYEIEDLFESSDSDDTDSDLSIELLDEIVSDEGENEEEESEQESEQGESEKEELIMKPKKRKIVNDECFIVEKKSKIVDEDCYIIE